MMTMIVMTRFSQGILVLRVLDCGSFFDRGASPRLRIIFSEKHACGFILRRIRFTKGSGHVYINSLAALVTF